MRGGLTPSASPTILPGMATMFTLEQANALLPLLREILADLRRAVAALEQVEGDVGELRAKIRRNGRDVPDEALTRQQAARETINQQISRINELGCELKDPRLGLIDFPSERQGRVVYLCWKLGEPEVAYWHPLDTGIAGRQPL
jgi:hypothetical protein